MRSRLEARWASMFETLEWHWEYEPDLQAGFVIPDFVLPSFAHPVVVECKPALTVAELATRRRQLIGRLRDWLRDDVMREIAELDQDPDSPVELSDRALDDLVRVGCGQNPQGRSRRVLVVGPALHMRGDAVTVDGEYGFCVCSGHVGLTQAVGASCLLCGNDATGWAHAPAVWQAWRESQNEVQWQRP